MQVRQETPESLVKKYKRVSPNEAKAYWNEQYRKSATECTHVFRQGHCTNVRNCEIGLRTRKFYILAGSVLTVWSKVESVLSSLTGYSQFRLQIIRVKTNDDNKIVGCVIPTMCLKQINALLLSMSAKTYTQNHVANDNESNCIVLDDECDSSGLSEQISSLNGIKMFNSPNSKPMITATTTIVAGGATNSNKNEKYFKNLPNQILNYEFT